MAAFSVQNAVFATTLLVAGFSGGRCAIISHESMLVARRSQLVTDGGLEASVVRRNNLTRAGSKGFSFMEAQKPIRIVRHGEGGGSAIPGSDGKPVEVSKYTCGSTHKVSSTSNKNEVCPQDCPFYVQNRKDDDFCTFACVTEPDCAKFHPETQIGDKDLGVCRSCIVEGCSVCDASATKDKCAKCQWAYNLTEDGQCHFRFYHDAMLYFGYFLLGVVGLVALWIVDMAIRPIYNTAGLEHAQQNRDNCRVLQDKDAEGNRQPFPLLTNLCSKNVGGPGMILHFNFQVMLIGWALFVACVWMGFASGIDEALWILGTRRFGTPRMNCILVFWGYETQQRLMWTKVLFLVIVYLVSFAGAIFYGIHQMRCFTAIDSANKTMKDYVVMLNDLPITLTGSSNVEDDLKKALEDQVPAIKGKVVGVSVAWEYADHEEQIDEYLHDEVNKLEPHPEVPFPEGVWPHRKFLMGLEASILGIEEAGAGEETPKSTPRSAREQAPIEDVLDNMHISSRAFVVFNTEEDRDTAVEAENFKFHDSTVTFEEIEAEPDTVCWQNFGRDSPQEQAVKIVCGFGYIGLACAAWAIVFYSPYAYYVMTFNYENGRQPGFIVGFSFSMIVCVGNVIMYEVCGRISDWVGFRFRDQREACYMILYTIACMFNVALDFVTTYFTAEMVMEGLGFKTYFGVPLQDVPTFTQKFETYGMQRSLAENTYSYAFPSTFLIPFLIEPVATVTMPYLVGRWLVKSHVGLQGRDAEEWLEMAPMDMGRYADLLLNVILGILIFYFPGGYTWMLFLGMAGSHAYIYLFDQYKVLREIPSCKYASYDVEWWCQAMFAPIIGIMASCFMFKANCEPGMHCTTGMPLIALCCLGWMVHVVIHMLVLLYVVPMFKLEKGDDPEAGKTYREVATGNPSTWFSTNKIHCLRSKLKHKHEPACSFMRLGKEKHIRANPSIGCYFDGAGKSGA